MELFISGRKVRLPPEEKFKPRVNVRATTQVCGVWIAWSTFYSYSRNDDEPPDDFTKHFTPNPIDTRQMARGEWIIHTGPTHSFGSIAAFGLGVERVLELWRWRWAMLSIHCSTFVVQWDDPSKAIEMTVTSWKRQWQPLNQPTQVAIPCQIDSNGTIMRNLRMVLRLT